MPPTPDLRHHEVLVPSLRVENYHEALCDSTRMARRAETTSHMLDRLRNAVAAELTAVQSVENRADDARRVRTVAAVTFVTFVTTIGGTLSLLFGFFGINAIQVNADRSMFAPRYVWIYLVIVFLIGGAAAIFLGMRAQERRQYKRDQRRTWIPAQRSAVRSGRTDAAPTAQKDETISESQ